MAKEQNHHSKARILFGFAEVEGGDPVVVESVRSLAASVVRALQGPQSIRTVKGLSDNSSNGKIKDAEKTLFDAPEPEIIDQDETVNDGDMLDIESAATPASLKEPHQPKKAPTYNFVPDLNLRPTDKSHLKAFYGEKKPEDQMEQLAVFVYYLAKVLGIDGIGVNHLYTCFKEVEQRVPKNILQSIHNTKSRRGWLDASDPAKIRINTSGENLVEHDLPQKTAT